MPNKLSLYLNTVKYLKPVQIGYRIKRKIAFPQKIVFLRKIKTDTQVPAYKPLHLYLKELDADRTYLKRFDCESALDNNILLLHEKRRLQLKTWTVTGEATHLWMFNLQYMEYLIPLSIRFCDTGEEKYYQKVKDVLNTWIHCFKYPEGDAWNAYVISKRIVNWLILMDLLNEQLAVDPSFEKDLVSSLYLQYRYLLKNPEKHLLGNHYFENLTAIVIAAAVFGDQKNLDNYIKKFCDQMQEQVLKDGMHFERSFMYHRIIIEDILRVTVVLKQLPEYTDAVDICEQMLKRMLDFMLSLEGGLERIPLFNDAGNNVAKPVEALKVGVYKYADSIRTINEVDNFPESGYYKYDMHHVRCIIDCGPIGPDYIPGHGQCDCLSYEIYVNGAAFIVNSGTFQYQSSRRGFFRSTQAHNCFTVNGYQQSQCWGEHRVAGRISHIWADRESDEFNGGCIFWNGIKVQRKFLFQEKSVTVHDACENCLDATIRSYIHLAPGVMITADSDMQYGLTDAETGIHMKLDILQAERIQIYSEEEICDYADEFGRLQKKSVFEITGAAGEKIIYKLQW